MKKYYFKDSAGQQQGPLKLDKLKARGSMLKLPSGMKDWKNGPQPAR